MHAGKNAILKEAELRCTQETLGWFRNLLPDLCSLHLNEDR
jgi:hypothetical protein